MWLAHTEENDAWLVFSTLGLLAFSLLRIETFLFALVFIALWLGAAHPRYRVRLAVVLPYLAVMIARHALLIAWEIVERRVYLGTRNIVLILVFLFLFGVFVLISNMAWLERIVLRRLPTIILVAFSAALLAAVVWKPAHMAATLWAILNHLFNPGYWAGIWWLQLVLIPFVIRYPKVPLERLFTVGVPAFLMLLALLSLLRSPYHLGWGDSANRMLTHILPVSLLYFLMKYAAWLAEGKAGKKAVSEGIV
jgi:hypothetical protein